MINLSRVKNLEVKATVRDHVVHADVLKDLGGDDHGMNPHELLESSLAACTAITLQMHARKKSIPLEDIKVEVQVLSEGTDSVISRKIELIGALDEAQKKRMIEIAEMCPIHKFLESNIKVVTSKF